MVSLPLVYKPVYANYADEQMRTDYNPGLLTTAKKSLEINLVCSGDQLRQSRTFRSLLLLAAVRTTTHLCLGKAHVPLLGRPPGLKRLVFVLFNTMDLDLVPVPVVRARKRLVADLAAERLLLGVFLADVQLESVWRACKGAIRARWVLAL